jgi:hypothetical protein
MPGYELCCSTCRKKVSRVVSPDGEVWYGHPGNLDRHKVVPLVMAPADVIRVCDFCLAVNPRWVFPLLERASTRTFHPGLGITMAAEDSDGWWAACSGCADLIRDRKVTQLRDRALAVLKDRQPDPISWQDATWQKESVLLQLAAFWRASPGAPVEVGLFS